MSPTVLLTSIFNRITMFYAFIHPLFPKLLKIKQSPHSDYYTFIRFSTSRFGLCFISNRKGFNFLKI